MKFDLIIKERLDKLQNFEFEVDEEESLTEVLCIVEEALYETKKIDFEFNCLGEKWSVCIFGEFSIFAEQLSDIYKLCINKSDCYELEFF